MNQKSSEQRKFKRYSSEVEVIFQVAYPFQADMNFQIIDSESGEPQTSKYQASSKNIGVEGLCFTTSFRLEQGEKISLEVMVPGQKKNIPMEGVIRWSRQCFPPGKERKYDSGIKILTVNGKPLSETFEYDDSKQIVWSAVLQTILGDSKEEAKKDK